jgi:hypothetical protein
MRVLEAGDWSLLLPDEWFAEEDEDGIFIGDRDGVGVLQFSELRRVAGAGGATLQEELLDPQVRWSAITCGSFVGMYGNFEEEGMALREWVLRCHELVLLITYSCERAHRGLDDAAVDELLATLRYAPEDPA